MNNFMLKKILAILMVIFSFASFAKDKLKIGVSGCPNSCADSHTRDIGLIGGPKGWILYLRGTKNRK